MARAIATLNAGSSSLKFEVFDDNGSTLDPILRGIAEGLHTEPRFTVRDSSGSIVGQEQWANGTSLGHDGALRYLFDWLDRRVLRHHALAAVGHRVVHGGIRYSRPVLVDDHVLAELTRLEPLMPLHQPFNLEPIRILRDRMPQLPQVACFDTAFHRSMPEQAQLFAIPRRLTEQGLRRYGFHGISYQFIASVLPDIDPVAASGRTIVAHLGNGASLCAMMNRSSVATTMGFSALDGLMMGTRCGSIDPAILLYLIRHHDFDVHSLERLLYRESGLLGVSEISSDLRDLLASRDARASEAIELFVYRISRDIGSMAAALGGVDAVVFTGGIGENSALIRERVCSRAAWLGLTLDEQRNMDGGPRISADQSRVSAWVIPTNEELVIARDTRSLLRDQSNIVGEDQPAPG